MAPVGSRATERATESGFRVRTQIVPVLRQGSREFRLDRPRLDIGRSAVCEIQVMSALVSRQHARLTVSSLGIAVEDLGSRNGVYVNSERVIGSVQLRSGDRLAVGDEVLVLGEIEEPVPDATKPTLASTPAVRTTRNSFSEDEGTATVATRNADVFHVLSGVVDKALALGRGEEAEHLIASHLDSALSDVLAGRHLSQDLARTAAGYAVRLAGATGKPTWLDYAVRLYSALDLVLPLALVDEMYVLLRRVHGIKLDELRVYTEKLRERTQKLAPAERFVLQRLLGLERLAAWQSSTR